MQQSSSIVDRVIGALRLDPATYEEVEHDSSATGQAILVVVVVAILSGIGASQRGTGAIVGNVIIALLGWAIYTFFVHFVGTTFLKGPDTSASFEQVLRPLGFAYAPSALTVLGLIPAVGGLIAFLAGIWSLVASIVAIRQSLEVSNGRAIGIAIVAVIVMAIVLGIILAIILGIFGIGLYGIESVMRSAPAS